MRVSAPGNGDASPITTADGADVDAAGATPVRLTTQLSSPLTVASPLDVALITELVEPLLLPMPVWPPNWTSTSIGSSVVFLKPSSQRPQLSERLKCRLRQTATPPRSTALVERKRLGGS